MVRFGRWEEILEHTPPADPETMASTNAILIYARGLAYAALGKVKEAEAEQALFLAAAASETMKPRQLHNNKVTDLLDVHALVLAAEISYRKGKFSPAFADLRRAVELEDALPYDEPWGVMQPCRHALGALLLEQGHAVEAEQVYRDDMAPGRHPENPWSLFGLKSSLSAQGASKTDVAAVEARLAAQLAKVQGVNEGGGFTLTASCACAGRPIVGETAAPDSL